MTTIKDVAAQAGVSIKTVSRVLNDEAGVAEATRQRVKETIQELGYVPNLSAQRLRRGKSKLLTLILPRVKSPYATQIFSCILAEVRIRDYSLLTLEGVIDEGASNIDQLGRVIKNHRVDGVIVAPPGADRTALMNFLKQNNVPYVIINPNILNAHPFSIESTDQIGAYEAIQYLIELGHNRIAHIACLETERFSRERKIGYLRAMEDAGLEFESFIFQGDNSIESGYNVALEFLNLVDPPTAVFAGNDEMAIGTILAALHLGLTIPGDLSVVGFDNAASSNWSFPRLTTVAQPIAEIAQVSVGKLLDFVEKPHTRREHIQIQTQLIVRDSCGVPS